jgi:hypothetical protein
LCQLWIKCKFDGLGWVVDGTIQCLTKNNVAAEIQSLKLFLELCESNAAAGLPQNQVLPLGLNAGPHIGHGKLIFLLLVFQLICFVGRWFLLHTSNNLIRLIRLKSHHDLGLPSMPVVTIELDNLLKNTGLNAK